MQIAKRKHFIPVTIAFCVLLLICFTGFQILHPGFEDVRYRTTGRFVGDQERLDLYEGTRVWEQELSKRQLDFVTPLYPHAQGEWRSTELPLYAFSAGNQADIEFTLKLRALHPWAFRIAPDDCLEELEINGKTVLNDDGGVWRFCNLEGETVDLNQYLTGGENNVRVRIRDNGGFLVFRMTTAASDHVLLFLRIATLILLWGYVAFIAVVFYRKKFQWNVFAALVFCSALALVYAIRFFYYNFSYDADGHVNYIIFMRSLWSIPPPEGYGAEGWQFYQPPLYYFIVALWWVVGGFFGRNQWWLIEDAETLSWIFISLSLGISALISTRVFKLEKEKFLRPLHVLLIGTIPGVLFMASRISNDVLFFLLSVLFLYLSLLWWHEQKRRDWILLWIIVGCAFLTKSNSMLLLAAAAAMLVLKNGIPIFKRIGMGVMGIAIVFLCAGWYGIVRIIFHGQNVLVGNLNALHIGLRFEPHFSQLFVFNPLALFRYPFNNPWSDTFRRQYFWEYFYRSAYFGEWDFGHKATALASLLLLIGVPLIGLAVYGLYRSLRTDWRKNAPMWIMLVLGFCAAISYRTLAPYGCNQDFRFIAPVVVPIMYYLLVGIQALPKKHARIAWHTLTVYLCCAVAFLLSVTVFFGA